MHNISSPDTSDSAIEREIKAKGKVAPRVTLADVEAHIVGEHYFTAIDGVDGRGLANARALEPTKTVALCPLRDDPGALSTTLAPLSLLTFCVLVLRNDFTVTGESACASAENFDAEIGCKVARANAVQKVWPLLGYALRDELFSNSNL